MKFVKLLDGSYISAAHITRLHITSDVTRDSFGVIANMAGPQMPYAVADTDSRDRAQEFLDSLVAELEGKTPVKNPETSFERILSGKDDETVHRSDYGCIKGRRHSGPCDYGRLA